LNREQLIEVIKVHLDGPVGSTLTADTSNHSLECAGGTGGRISWGTYHIIDETPFPELCECGEYYDDECELCTGHMHYLLEKVENLFSKKILLNEFLELATDTIDKQVTKDMEEIFPYSSASHIINYTERYKNELIDVYDGCGDELSREDALKLIDNVFELKNENRQIL
jgi:hypothetical protein